MAESYMIDILFVTYNSAKWLDNCVKSIADSKYDLKKVTLCFYDNASVDDTVAVLKRLKSRYGSRFHGFEINKSEKNMGFGCGNNGAARLGKGEFIFCLNVDTSVYPDTLAQIENEVQTSDDCVGLWELRQLPYEHPKFYDPITQETSWSSGACFVIRRSLFESLGGFDEHLFMYGEDVDLSWRVRAEGYILKYIPKAVVNHYCYQSSGEVKPKQYAYSLVNNLYLRHKYANRQVVSDGYKQFIKVLKQQEPFEHAHSMVRKAFFASIPAYFAATKWKRENRKKIEGKRYLFLGWDYEFIRDGAFYVNERPTGNIKVSVLVRTCGRPEVLRETLISLRKQTYANIEIVVVEDGEEVSRGMIERDFGDLNLVYEATGKKVGRSAVGNRALSLATGEYLNFLDDDDVFFEDHIETLVMDLERHPEHKIAYSLAFDTPITVLSTNPYRYEIKGYYGHVKDSFNRLELLHHNLFPIQAVMFDRSVYTELGGLDERMDALEDWDLWVRYATKYAFHQVYKTTSIYRVPADSEVADDRRRRLEGALSAARQKQTRYALTWTSEELLNDYLQGVSSHAAQPVILNRRLRDKIKDRLPIQKLRSMKAKVRSLMPIRKLRSIRAKLRSLVPIQKIRSIKAKLKTLLPAEKK